MATTPLLPGCRPWLWICREMPWPLVSGDRVYSAGLARALADAGVAVKFVGHRGPEQQTGPAHAAIDWCPIDGGTRPAPWVALTERLPITAGIHDTKAARRLLDEILVAHRFDAIVLDQLGSGWALEHVLNACARLRRRGHAEPTLIYLAHNFETKVWADMASQASGSLPHRIAVKRNAEKVARLERRMVLAADRVACITDEDAQLFRQLNPEASTLVLTPGYEGEASPERTINADTPRRVAMVGSFSWAIKQENLRQFLAVADAAFARSGIHFDVIGKVPDSLRAELEPTLNATTLHGFVDDPRPIFARSRLAVVPEIIGGGFKLKLLDYLFARMPIASIAAAVAGMPAAVREHMVLADDCERLVEAIIAAMDDPDDLQNRQQHAFRLAEQAYRWMDRGRALRNAVYRDNDRSSESAGPEDGSKEGATVRKNMPVSSRQVA